MSGTAESSSEVSGTLTLGIITPLAGAASAEWSAIGSLTLGTVEMLAGEAAVVSDAEGNLTLIYPLSGLASIDSIIIGTLTIPEPPAPPRKHEVHLVGLANCQSPSTLVTGTLTVRLNRIILSETMIDSKLARELPDRFESEELPDRIIT